MTSFLQDVRQALRSLAGQPGFTAVTVATLALGLGLNTAVVTAAYGILWRPLPFDAPDRLVTLTVRYGEDGRGARVRPGQFSEWRDRIRTVHLAGHLVREHTLRSAGPARVITATAVTSDFFEVLQVSAAVGFAPRLAGGDVLAVVSARLARTLDMASPVSAIGELITLGDTSYEVVGVMPESFAFPTAEVDVWIGLPPDSADPGNGRLELIGRLGSRATIAQARDDATRVAREINSDEWYAEVTSLEETLLDEARPAVLAALAAAALVLAVACASTITLMLGRSIARGHEFALRSALGAGAGRLARTAFMEGLMVATGGLVVGLFVAWTSLRVFTTRAVGLVPRVSEVGLDLPTVLAAVGLTLAVGGVCGGAAAVGAMRRDGAELLRGTVRTATPVTRKLRAALVAAQLALSIVLMTGAGLLTRSVTELLAEDGGFNPGPVLTARLMLDDSRFIDDPSTTDFVNRLLERVRALPTVEAAGIGSLLPPIDAPITLSIRLRSDTRDDTMEFSYGAVTSGFFEALGTPLRDGRHFVEQDERAEVADTIVSVSAARFMFPDDDPVGRGPNFAVPTFGIERDTTMVGVVADMKFAGLDSAPVASMYIPWQLRPMGLSHLVKTSGYPATLVPTVRNLIMELNPTLPLPDVRTLDDHIANSIAGRRLQLVPAAAVAALALAVAMVGLFGTLGRAVTERRLELSIRAAVGASPGRLVRLVLRGSVTVTALGLAVGLSVAAATGRGLSSLLYRVSPYDPLTFAAVAGVVLVASLTASIIPARRAARLDPLIALKGD